MVRGDSDLQSIDLSLARQNGAGNNLLRYGIDSRTELQKRDVGQCLESLLGHLRVAISCFIDDVLRSHQFVVRSLRFPPPTCEVLSRSRDDVGAGALTQVAHHAGFKINSRRRARLLPQESFDPNPSRHGGGCAADFRIQRPGRRGQTARAASRRLKGSCRGFIVRGNRDTIGLPCDNTHQEPQHRTRRLALTNREKSPHEKPTSHNRRLYRLR